MATPIVAPSTASAILQSITDVLQKMSNLTDQHTKLHSSIAARLHMIDTRMELVFKKLEELEARLPLPEEQAYPATPPSQEYNCPKCRSGQCCGDSRLGPTEIGL
jgi:hypothetical protein